jgi:cytochrome c biogenesis protein ResB
VLIAHVSVVFMLLAGLVSLLSKKEGAVWVTENQTVDEFDSFHLSTIRIEQLEPAPADGKREAMLIPDGQFADLTKGKARTFYSDNLPFDLMVMNYMDHCAVRPAKAGDPQSMVVDGYILQELPKKDAEGKPVPHEQLVNGAYVKAIDKKTKAEQLGIIVRTERAPWTVTMGDKSFGVGIGRRQYRLPFEVKLDKFVRETHAGTSMARKFTSHVTVIRDGKSEEKIINMNEPLRYGGFAFFQSSFDMEAAQSGGQQSSMFQVASNPSDHWPLISLIAAMIGLLMNLVWHLTKFLKQSARSNVPIAPPSV